MQYPLDAPKSINLKWRILFGSLAVALLVIGVFVVVSLKIAKDVGFAKEEESLHDSAHLVRFNIEELKRTGEIALNAELIFSSLATTAHDLSFILYQESGVLTQIKAQGDHSVLLELVTKMNTQGAGEFHGLLVDSNVAWYLDSSDNNQVLVAKPLTSLSLTLDLVLKRLGITALLTFLVAVWTALILSSIIAKASDQSRRHLSYIASHDFLTGLHNRYYFEKTITRFLRRAKTRDEGSAKPSVLMSVDLNKFKCINDNFGHATGDAVLVKVAQRIRNLLPESHLISRTGGDEFFIWMFNKTEENAVEIAKDIQMACSKPIIIGVNSFIVGTSIGITLFPKHGNNLVDLIKNADNAMYRAKRLRAPYIIFDAREDTTSEVDVKLSGELSRAIKNNEFALYFQPKIRVTDQALIGFELLVRWIHPTRGLLFPDSFIHLLEQSEYINRFTNHLMERVCEVVEGWQKLGIAHPIAINLSPYNLLSSEVFEQTQKLMKRYPNLPKMIELELTESAAMSDEETTVKRLNEFKELGIKVSLDDFGIGMSSLSYIRSLPIDCVKIDKSFIANVNMCSKARAFYRGVTNLCQCFDIPVVAEGVETAEQFEFLQQIGCEVGQGYYWSKPMPQVDVTNYCAQFPPFTSTNIVQFRSE